MSQLSKGPIVVQRSRSLIEQDHDAIGRLTPDIILPLIFGAAPGAIGQFVFVAPRAMRVVGMRHVANTNGAGSSKIYLRKHVAGQTAAANAATSGTDIVDLVSGGIAADSTVRAPTTPTVVSTYANLAAEDKLALVTPATWVGTVTVFLAWL